jgi:hypothetical protein
MNSIRDIGFFLIGAALSAVVSVIFGPPIEQLASRFIGIFIPGNDADLRGRWRSTYHYLSDGKRETAVQFMKLTQIGRTVYGKNIGGSSYHRHAVRLHIDGDWVTGTWRNTVQAARHHGVLQLRLLANGRSMEGRWLGFDGSAAIQEGDWKWERIS